MLQEEAVAEQQKDTIYVDLDDEITNIIDKVRSSPSKIVALVLPKRAATLQSIVNMRLLKRTADEAKKNIVLITSEAGILPLAGAAKVHVAKTLQSKPHIPPSPNVAVSPLRVSEDDRAGVEDDAEIDESRSIGELAGLPPEPDDETIEIDNDQPEPVAAMRKDKANKKNKKFKIPNFNKFRAKLILGVLGFVGLIVLWYAAFFVMPKAAIVIKTDNTSYATNVTLTASPTAKELDMETKTVPALAKEYKKTGAAKVAATGDKDLGNKATGTMTVYNCTDDTVTVPAGTVFTNSSFSFALDEAVTVPASDFFSNGSCKKNKSADVAVTATQAGGSSNLSGGREYSSNFASTLTGTGSAMSGGTSNIVKVVSQADIDAAKQKILDQNLQTGKNEVSKLLSNDGYLPLPDTLNVPNPVVTATPAVGEQATEVNVSVTATYAMTGARMDDVKKFVDQDSKEHIDTGKQKIFDYGFEDAAFRDVAKQPNGDVKFSLQTQIVAGVQQDAEGIKQAVAGKKKGQAQTLITSRPGVKEVSVNTSPFWVFNVPKNTSKITVTFEQVQ